MSDAPIQVWIVEDNVHLRDTIRDLVDEAQGMACALAAGSWEEALDALGRGDVPQVVLTDLGLPGMSGIEGIARIRDRSPSSAVVVLSVHEEDDQVFDALCAGAAGYLLKPASSERIVEAIRTAHGGGAPMNAFVARRVLQTFAAQRPENDYGLTKREREILELLAEEYSQKEMAAQLFLSPHTVDTHLRNIYAKLHVRTRAGAVAKALREGLL